MPNAAAVYARISSDPEGDGLGVTRRVQDCQRLAERRGWPIGEVYSSVSPVTEVRAVSRAASQDGQRIEVRGCDLWTFRDGTVVKKDSYWKIRTTG